MPIEYNTTPIVYDIVPAHFRFVLSLRREKQKQQIGTQKQGDNRSSKQGARTDKKTANRGVETKGRQGEEATNRDTGEQRDDGAHLQNALDTRRA